MKFLRHVRCRLDQCRTGLYLAWLRRQPGIAIGKVLMEGLPMIDVRDGGRLIIEDDVRLKSSNAGYHLNMYGPVKLFVDQPGAVLKIGAGTRVYGSCIHAFANIEIGRKCLIAANCQIMDANGHELSFPEIENRPQTKDRGKPIVLEDCVWLGAGTMILPGVRLGRGSVIGAGSVVTRDVPPMSLAAGNPAKVIRCYAETPSSGPAGEAQK